MTAETVEGWLELELDSDSEKENEETIDDIEIIDNDFGEPCFIDLETWESKERLKRRRSGLEFSEAEVLKILEETEDEENYVKVWEV